MGIEKQQDPQPEAEPSDEAAATNLYIGHLYKLVAFTNDEETEAYYLGGEILLQGRVEGERFSIKRVQRVALYGALLDSSRKGDIGTISLAGPLEEAALESNPIGLRATMNLQLHYHALSDEPLYGQRDVVFPSVETLNIMLQFTEARVLSEQEVEVMVESLESGLTIEILGLVRRLTIKSTPVLFRLPGSLVDLPEGYEALWACDPITSCDTGPHPDAQARLLPLKFVNVSSATPANLLKAWQEGVKGICEVWGKKAALVIVDPIIDLNPGLSSNYRVIDYRDPSVPGDEQNTLARDYDPASFEPPGYVEVYLIDQLNNTGGGCTIHPGVAESYCIVAVPNLLVDKYILAHEIGHVFGLEHPDGFGTNIGSFGSVMDDNVLGAINTQQNCNILDSATLNPLIVTMGTMDCCQPDPDPQ
jgi:hypothetical protein